MTAVERRISYWSSDVSSPDLEQGLRQQAVTARRTAVAVLGHSSLGAHQKAQARVHVAHIARRDRIGGCLRAGTVRVGDAIAGLGQQLVQRTERKIGRASCRERVCQYV